MGRAVIFYSYGKHHVFAEPHTGVCDGVMGEGPRVVPSLLGKQVPVRDGMWFGHGRDEVRGRDVVLVGGGFDAGRSAHSDVYAVDLEAGGDTERVAVDDGLDLGPDAWLSGRRDDRGWTLRLVPARRPDGASVRFGAYLRTSATDGWAPAGMSARDTPRADAARADAVAHGSSCELDGAPWYAPPGRLVYDDRPDHPVLRCEQPPPVHTTVEHLPRQVKAFALGNGYVWTVSPAGLERWNLARSSPVIEQRLALGLPGSAKDPAVLAASAKLVAVARGETVAVFTAANDGFARAGTVTDGEEGVALHAGVNDLWIVGERRIHHYRVAAGALGLLGSFELVRYEGDLFARRLPDGPAEDSALPDGNGGNGYHDEENAGEIVGASIRGAMLAIIVEHDLVTLDLREPSRLPTLGSRHFDERLRAVATDGRFVYLRLGAEDDEGDGADGWRAYRATAVSALDPAGTAPARSFAKKRQCAGRYAARLTGVALHVATSEASAP